MQSRTNVRPLTFTTDSGAIPMRVCAEARIAFSSALGGWVISSLLRYCACPAAPGGESQGGKLSCDKEEPGKLSSNVAQPARDRAKTQKRMPRALSTRAGFTVFSLENKYSDRGAFSQTGLRVPSPLFGTYRGKHEVRGPASRPRKHFRAPPRSGEQQVGVDGHAHPRDVQPVRVQAGENGDVRILARPPGVAFAGTDELGELRIVQ